MLVGAGDRCRVVKTGHDQDRYPAASERSPKFRAGRESVHLRHHYVQHHDIRPAGDKLFQRPRPILGLADPDSGLLKGIAQERSHRFFIIDQER